MNPLLELLWVTAIAVAFGGAVYCFLQIVVPREHPSTWLEKFKGKHRQ